MALFAEVFRRIVLQVAVRALERVLIVRGHVRIRRFHILGFFNQLFGVVAAGTRFDGRNLRILHIHVLAVAAFTSQTTSNVSIGTKMAISSKRRASEQTSAKRER